MIDLNEFTNPKLKLSNMDIYPIRSLLLRAVKNATPLFAGTLLDIGCGYMPYRELILASTTKIDKYIGLDLEPKGIYQNSPDLIWDGNIIPLEGNTIDCAMATELFEHCDNPECVMKEVSRVLKPGGLLFFTVPFLWPLHDVPHDQYRYTPFSLKRHLTSAGFKKINIWPHGEWDISLAQIIGLYVRRKPIRSWHRTLLSVIAYPIVYLLIHIEQRRFNKHVSNGYYKDGAQDLTTIFRESTLTPGLWGIAYKTNC